MGSSVPGYAHVPPSMGYTTAFTCNSCGHHLELNGLGRDRGWYFEVESCLCHQCQEVVDVVRNEWREESHKPTVEELQQAYEEMTYPHGHPHRFRRWLRKKLGMQSEFADDIARALAKYDDEQELKALNPKEPELQSPLDVCPRCQNAEVMPWNEPYACPKCGDSMERLSDHVALWD